ncbi:hypothetical protein RFI_05509 [Reticulomyxa filosa]|uniref:Uncharacterized protein n=1 Tax=Reticulomyxa filosa TaxID=46433 RepID=X6P034_RETFI|nr:hypothetical protein RFI_05509 [Reticulomyxa filosa]|eukprot:ETO31611.1 hypothetical protein RFI_05509 [Reticulomyxa filosa]
MLKPIQLNVVKNLCTWLMLYCEEDFANDEKVNQVLEEWIKQMQKDLEQVNGGICYDYVCYVSLQITIKFKQFELCQFDNFESLNTLLKHVGQALKQNVMLHLFSQNQTQLLVQSYVSTFVLKDGHIQNSQITYQIRDDFSEKFIKWIVVEMIEFVMKRINLQKWRQLHKYSTCCESKINTSQPCLKNIFSYNYFYSSTFLIN